MGWAPAQYATQAVVRAPRAPAAVHAAAAASAAFTETVEGPRKKDDARAKPRGSTAAYSMAPQRARPLQALRGGPERRRVAAYVPPKMYTRCNRHPNNDKETVVCTG